MPTRDLSAPVEIGAGISIRPATAADARLYTELALAHRPDEPEDPEVVAHYWANPAPGIDESRFLIEVDGAAAGYGYQEQRPAGEDPEGNGFLQAWLVPRAFTPDRMRAAIAHLEERSVAAGVRVITSEAWEDDQEEAAVLLAAGYARDRLSKAWELDLVEHGDRLLLMADRSAALLREMGIRCHAVADDPDPDIWRRCHEAHVIAGADIPRTEAYIPPTWEQFLNWYTGPDTSPRWFFVAKDGDRVVAVSDMRVPPNRGHVWTGFTGVLPEYRGRGLARGVKLAIVRQAVEHNVARVRTDNDETNGAMLHINEDLGYHRIPGVVSYRRTV